ncbi:MAG: hypothetical protein LRY72_18230 [Saccharospirillaceae bacterium]|nr:hypothetical protein [Saccharospirillaceae bacterium]
MQDYALRSMIPMTRIKKTRSLKRIHKVKTGSISKLKREAGGNRQSTKRLKDRKTLSVFEKYLLENPEAKQALIQPTTGASNKEAGKKTPAGKQQSEATVKAVENAQERTERSKTLLEQLDSKDFDSFY